MKVGFYLKLAVFIVLVFSCSVMYFGKVDVKALQIGGNNTLKLFNGVFQYSEDIIIQGNATLIVENATVRLIQSRSDQYSIRLQNPANGSPRLIAKNVTFESSRTFNISLMGNSSADLTDVEFRRPLELYDSSVVNIFDSSDIYYIYCYDSSQLRSFGSRVSYLYAYDNSNLNISTATVSSIIAEDNSTVRVSVSSLKKSITTLGSSLVSVSFSTFSGSALVKETSSVLLSDIRLDKAQVYLIDYSNVTIVNATSFPSKYPCKFSVRGFSNLFFSDSQINDASFWIYGNSTFEAKKSDLLTVIIYSYGNASLQVFDSSISWLIECEDNSNLFASNSSFNIVSGKDSSDVILDTCHASQSRSFDSSSLAVSDSTLDEVLVEQSSVIANLTGIRKGFFDNRSFAAGNFYAVFSDTTINSWSLTFYGFSDVNMYDSKLLNIGVYDSSNVLMWNSTYSNANVKNNSRVYVYSYLTVRAVDYFGAPVEGATVSVTLSGVLLESKLTNGDGVALFTLFERLLNSSGVFPAGNYNVDIAFGDYSSQSSVELMGSQISVSTIPSPWWFWYMIWGSIGSAILALGFGVFWFFIRKKKL